jgi:hypothetical protein
MAEMPKSFGTRLKSSIVMHAMTLAVFLFLFAVPVLWDKFVTLILSTIPDSLSLLKAILRHFFCVLQC